MTYHLKFLFTAPWCVAVDVDKRQDHIILKGKIEEVANRKTQNASSLYISYILLILGIIFHKHIFKFEMLENSSTACILLTSDIGFSWRDHAIYNFTFENIWY